MTSQVLEQMLYNPMPEQKEVDSTMPNRTTYRSIDVYVFGDTLMYTGGGFSGGPKFDPPKKPLFDFKPEPLPKKEPLPSRQPLTIRDFPASGVQLTYMRENKELLILKHMKVKRFNLIVMMQQW